MVTTIIKDYESIELGDRSKIASLTLKFNSELKKFRIPKIYGIKLYPGFFLVPAIYILSWIYFPSIAGDVTGKLLAMIVLIAAVALIFVVIGSYRDSESGKVGLFKSWVEAKKRMVCPLLKFH